MVAAQGQALGLGQGFLKFGGQFVETHGNSEANRYGSITEAVVTDFKFTQAKQP
jgi:hypothetical protein